MGILVIFTRRILLKIKILFAGYIQNKISAPALRNCTGFSAELRLFAPEPVQTSAWTLPRTACFLALPDRAWCPRLSSPRMVRRRPFRGRPASTGVRFRPSAGLTMRCGVLPSHWFAGRPAGAVHRPCLQAGVEPKPSYR